MNPPRTEAICSASLKSAGSAGIRFSGIWVWRMPFRMRLASARIVRFWAAVCASDCAYSLVRVTMRLSDSSLIGLQVSSSASAS